MNTRKSELTESKTDTLIPKPPRNNQLPALRALWQEAFGDTEEFLNDFYGTAFNFDRSRLITLPDGSIACALYWFDCLYRDRRVAYLYAVATAKAHRGQGYCHRLMSDTHHHLAALGYEGAILVPGSKQLFTFYESMGYQTFCQLREFRCTAAPDAIPVRAIDKTEYAGLRREFLPQGSVLQEQENLDFLQTQADFYTGPGFLLTACKSETALLGVELLGDATLAPAIVAALGYSEGRFRTPGTGMPFAMYRPLKGSTLPAPEYFGLAFD